MRGLRIASYGASAIRSLEVCQHIQTAPHRASPARAIAFFSTTRQRQQAERSRYGTANPPHAHLKGEPAVLKDNVVPEDQVLVGGAGDQGLSNVEAPIDLPEPGEAIPLPPPNEPSKAPTPPSQMPPPDIKGAKSPLDRVLDMESPNQPEEDKPPHLQSPKYVHHFDTFSLVTDLEKNGFSQAQAVTIMKAVRGLLGDNMNLARQALVSKSNVENESYLFKAACSELKTEIQGNRKADAEMWRTQKAQLQHEVDLLNQSLLQETSALKDELKGMFDNRKINTRLEEKNTQGKIQELNSRITVALNSDARGEIEGTRWLLTRRAAIGLTSIIFMIVISINYSKYQHAAEEAEKKKKTKAAEDVHELALALKNGGTQGLSEEALLAPDGAVGG